ncbi:MAG: DUF3160 domain-containing protein, partial [Verrucomicrobiales bacterium]
MKLSLGFTLFLAAGAHAQSLHLVPDGDQIQLRWDRHFPMDSGVTSWREYRVLTSSDLASWSEHSLIRSNDSEGNGVSTLDLPRSDGSQFFQLQTHLFYSHRETSNSQPAFYEQQYDSAFNRDLTLSGFTKQTADPACLDGISWDPTTASFFSEYNTTPADHNATLPVDDLERRIYNFTLNEDEVAKFSQNGFVVSPRVRAFSGPFEDEVLVAPTAVDLYYAIWTDDLPVFITADSVLDAWHQSFSSILEELDEIAVYPAVKQLVKHDWPDAFQTTTAAWNPATGTPQENARVQDAIDLVTFYIDVARGLLDTETPTSSSKAAEWYEAVANPDPEIIVKRDLYDDLERLSRPNLYKPRGRYTRSAVLSAHFRTLVWLSRAQFHIAHSDTFDLDQRNRELRAAVLLALTIRDGGLMDDWQKIEGMLQGIAGQSDAMTVPEMIALLEANSLDDISTIASDAAIARLRTALLASTYGMQEVNGGYYASVPDANCSIPEIEQHRALSLFGQRWTPDAWAFQKVVFPEVRNDEGNAIARRLPSGLDIAFSTLGNDSAAPILLERMQDPYGVSFRDGYPFQQNLAATRSVLDAQEEGFWTEHLYGRWLHGLRALSEPVSPSAPDTFRTTAWKRRILNTQLASWTQLRHDTLLYAKQSFTPPVLCEFPDGYVDPYPELWQRLSDIALAYQDFVETFDYEGMIGLEVGSWDFEELPLLPTRKFSPESGYSPELLETFPEIFTARIQQVDRGERLAAIKEHLTNFSVKCLTLKAIAEQQLSGQAHTGEMKTFIENTVEDFSIIGYTGDRLYNGWFPNLYFENVRQAWGEHPSSFFNPVVADVHTDGKDDCNDDPGAIL